MLDKIEKTITYNQFNTIVSGYLTNRISNQEMTDWIEVIFERGMSESESADYTKAIIESGTLS